MDALYSDLNLVGNYQQCVSTMSELRRKSAENNCDLYVIIH